MIVESLLPGRPQRSPKEPYQAVVDARLRPTFGNRKLTDLHRNDVQDYAEELLSEGLDPSTVRNVLMPLRVLSESPSVAAKSQSTPRIDLELPAVEGTRERVANPGEAQTLLDALAEDDRGLWATAVYAGLRNGELRALRAEDVDLKAGVERSWDDVEGLVDPKSRAGARTIPICEHLRGYLEACLEGCQRGLVFGDAQQRLYNYGKTTRRAYAAWKKAKLERITLHNARHSFRSYLDYAGISEARCDRYLGHANHSVGRRYKHAFESQLASDAALLDAYLTGFTAATWTPISCSKERYSFDAPGVAHQSTIITWKHDAFVCG